MDVLAHSTGKGECQCFVNHGKVTAAGACGCPVHGMKALRSEVESLRDQLRGAIEALREIAGGGYDDDHGKRWYYSQVDMRQIANRALDRLGGQ